MASHEEFSDKKTLVRDLWNKEHVVLVFPVNLNLDPLSVLTKHDNGYHDVGNVISSSKPGEEHGLAWLQNALSPSNQKHLLRTRSLSNNSSYTISDNLGTVTTKLTNGALQLENASIQVCFPECSVREFSMENWNDMIQHYDPDMEQLNAILPNSDPSANREFLIVQKVVVVPHIKITATYDTADDTRLDTVKFPLVLSPGVQVDRRYTGTRTVEYIVTASQKNHKLPIAFYGVKYIFDKFGIRESKKEQDKCIQTDSVGASSSHNAEDVDEDVDEDEDNSESESEDDDDEDIPGPANDENMDDVAGDDGFAEISSVPDPMRYTIFGKCDLSPPPSPPRSPPPSPPRSPPASPPASPPRDLEDID